MHRAKITAAIVRILYVAIIVWRVIIGDYRFLGWGGVIFVVTACMLYFARADERAYFVDAALLGLFSLSALSSVLLGIQFDTTVWGIDKVFHFAGGVFLGWFALIAYQRTLSQQPLVFMTVIILFGLALGAAWEVFEYAHMLFRQAAPAEYDKLLFSDTMLDLVADTAGAALVALGNFFHRTTKT